MPVICNTFLMNKPWALWKYVKKHEMSRFQLSQTQHISSCRPDEERAALFNSLLESCRCHAIKRKPASSKSISAQPRQQRGGECLAASYVGESVPGGEALPRSLLKLRRLQLTASSSNLAWKYTTFKKKEKVWGQSERKMLQRRASSAGRCGVRVMEVHGSLFRWRRL